MSQKIYDVIKQLLTDDVESRSSDKRLIWRFWSYETFGSMLVQELTYTDYLNCTSAETITRARREVQEHHPELQATKGVREARNNKAKKGHQIVFGQTVSKGFK